MFYYMLFFLVGYRSLASWKMPKTHLNQPPNLHELWEQQTSLNWFHVIMSFQTCMNFFLLQNIEVIWKNVGV